MNKELRDAHRMIAMNADRVYQSAMTIVIVIAMCLPVAIISGLAAWIGVPR